MPTVTPPPKKLLDQVRDLLCLKHYSRRTEESYVDWIKRYTLCVFHHKKYPEEMDVLNRGGLAVRSPLD